MPFTHTPSPTLQPRAALPLLVFMLLFLSAGLPRISTGAQSDNIEAIIQHLIGHVSESGLVFIRNGDNHTSVEAAQHMLKKYEHYRDEILSPEDFIRLCATRSYLSGKPYLVIVDDGKETPTSRWLTAELENYRAGHTTSRNHLTGPAADNRLQP